jgi:hypothetical protein
MGNHFTAPLHSEWIRFRGARRLFNSIVYRLNQNVKLFAQKSPRPIVIQWFTNNFAFSQSARTTRYVSVHRALSLTLLPFRVRPYLGVGYQGKVPDPTPSRFGVRRQLRPLWTFATDWRHARHTSKPQDQLAPGFPLKIYYFFSFSISSSTSSAPSA